MQYGNSSNSNCSATAPYYNFIETKISKDLGTIPIFNIPVTLYAHAVAKHGVGVPGDYALISLSPTTPMTMFGNNKTVINGSAFANGGISGNGSTACGGGWYSAGTVSGVVTNNTAPAVYSPPGCGTNPDPTPSTQGSLPPVADPYAGTQAPPAQGGSFPNCPECAQPGWWYNGSWHQGGSPSAGNGTVELFPGVYSTFSLGNSDKAYFNPGVYTFTSSIQTNHGNLCVFGAPTCDSNTCATQQWLPGDPSANSWYYSCSLWGFWDNSSFGGTRPASLPTTGPTWWDSAGSGSTTSVPLNGVTFYFPANAGGVVEHGNGGKNGGQYLAAPNPCPGTGTWGAQAVSFPAGHTQSAGENFDWTGSYTASRISPLPPSPAPQLYPNMDLSLLGECTASHTYEVWPNEMGVPQHLHFLFYMDPTGNDSVFNGASAQDFYGAFYAPGSNLKVTGAGKGGGGPPWVTGQIVVSTLDWGGNSTSDISYRPCGPGATPCGSGTGTQLVQ